MGGREPVKIESQVVTSGLVARNAVRVESIAGCQHVMLRRVGVLGQGLGTEIVGQADRLARTDEAGGSSPTLIGQMVQGAPLVVHTPSTPNS